MPKLLCKAGGIVGVILVVLLIVGGIGLYFGDEFFTEKNHISFYLGDFVKGFDMPPYVERITPLDYELKGVCDLRVQTSPEQTTDFIRGACGKYGYFFQPSDESKNGFQMEISRGYVVKGFYEDNVLKIRWQPVLPDKLKEKAKSIYIREP